MRGLRIGHQGEREDYGQNCERPEPVQAHGGSRMNSEKLRRGKVRAEIHGDSFPIAPGAGATRAH
jgi:hypothetical protein